VLISPEVYLPLHLGHPRSARQRRAPALLQIWCYLPRTGFSLKPLDYPSGCQAPLSLPSGETHRRELATNSPQAMCSTSGGMDIQLCIRSS
jgi:hypothetical protein